MSKDDHNLFTLGEAIKNLMKQNPVIKGKLDEKRIAEVWANVMGKLIVQYTKEITLRHKVIIVRLSSASLMNELTYAKEKILKNINEEFGEEIAKDIKFL